MDFLDTLHASFECGLMLSQGAFLLMIGAAALRLAAAVALTVLKKHAG